MAKKSIKISGPERRTFALDRAALNAEQRTVELAFSSEEPVDRWFGREVLDHAKKSADLARLNDGAPLLFNHDTDQHIGVVEKAWIDGDRIGRAVVRFGNSPAAQEKFQDVQDGILTKVSFAYLPKEMKLEKQAEDQPDTYRVTKWSAYEISMVTIPADNTVGVGRSIDTTEFEVPISGAEDNQEEKTMDKDTVQTQAPAASAPQVNVEAIKADARSAELARINEITAIGKRVNMASLAEEHIGKGTATDEFRKIVLERMGTNLQPVQTTAEIGMSDKEVRKFSLLRAIHAAAEKNWSLAPFEKECSDAVAKRVGKAAQGFFFPTDVMQRDLVAGTNNAGGYTVATDLLAASFIELLRNKMVLRQAGATVLDGLVGNVAIPKQSGGATAYWVAENGAPTESQQTLAQVALTPKTVGAYTDISRRLLLQSSISVEAMVRNDIATVLAIALDLAGLHGSGTSNQPTGIAATSGIGSVAGGTNGLAPAWPHIVGLETEVAIDNADLGALAYITNAKVRGKLKQTQRVTTYGNDMIWEPNANGMNGYPAHVTNQVSSTLTKGSSSGICSAIFFGNWADLIIALWGGLDITVDPYTGSTAGTVRVVGLQDADIGVRNAESFAAMLDALTT